MSSAERSVRGFDSIGFIGAGRVAHITLGGWKKAATALPEVQVFDVSAEALATLKAAFPFIRTTPLNDVAQTELIFVALHPPAMAETLATIGPRLRPEAVVVSLAPKVRLPELQEKLGGFARIARMNPNAPAIIGKGFNPISFRAGLSADARASLLAAVAPLGAAPVVADEMIEICAVISAMGPTYFWFQFETLRLLAEEFGIPPELARNAVSAMLHGAVDTLFDSGLPPSRVMDLVPVRPLAAEEEAIQAMLRTRVREIYGKLSS